MSQQDFYVAKMETQLQTWRAKLDAMRAQLDAAEMEARLEFHKQLEASQQQHEVACRHLDELKRSGEDAWEALKAGVEAVWKDSKNSPNEEVP